MAKEGVRRMDAREVTTWIVASATRDEVDAVFKAVSQRVSILAQIAVRQFGPGDRVRWEGRGGVTERGVVEKVNQSTLNVRTDAGKQWRVHGTLLQPEEA